MMNPFSPDPIDYAPGSFGCHEALCMAQLLADMVKEKLVDHPAVQQNPVWEARAQRAADDLADLYQSIGESHGLAQAVPEEAPKL